MIGRNAMRAALAAFLTAGIAHARIFDSTRDLRFLSMVEALLEQKLASLPHPPHWRDGGKVAILFHVDADGRVVAPVLTVKSRFEEIDRFAMDQVRSVKLPSPPPLEQRHGLLWSVKFNGDTPSPLLQLQ